MDLSLQRRNKQRRHLFFFFFLIRLPDQKENIVMRDYARFTCVQRDFILRAI